jgi:hypothetical protein
MTDELYPTTKEKVISLLDTFSRSSNNNNDNNISNYNDHDTVVAAHDASQDCYSDDDDDSDNESVLSYTNGEKEEANEAILLVNVKESPTEDTFKAMILANAVAKYDNDISEIEDNFINRNNDLDHQDLSGVFDDDEPDALACAHMVVLDGDDEDSDDFVVVNSASNNNNDNDTAIGNDIISDDPIGHFSERTFCVTRDKVTAVYAVAVVVINKKFKASNRVHTINNIIEYVDALICKFNNLGLASARMIYLALEHGSERINRSHSEPPIAPSVNPSDGTTTLSPW